MSVHDQIEANETVAPADDAAARLTPPAPTQDETAALGIAIGGFQEFTETPKARIALIGAKVLLFNFFLFAPIVALGWMLFS